MEFAQACRVLARLPTSPEHALTVNELVDLFANTENRIALRQMQNYMLYLSETMDPNLVRRLSAQEYIQARQRLFNDQPTDAKSYRYYVDPSDLTRYFMTEQMALNLMLAGQVLGPSMSGAGQLNPHGMVDVARQRMHKLAIEMQRIHECLRVVPDGIGRLPAKIDPTVMSNAIEAISKGRQVKIRYLERYTNQFTRTITPLGLVSKDGTVYLLGVEGLIDYPAEYSLHRIQQLDLDLTPAVVRNDFDLDKYISDTHQLSHRPDALPGPIEVVALELRVAPETVYHFKDRPLSADQKIEPAAAPNWSRVTANIPYTRLLVPFMLSMGHWIEVIAPEHIRKETADRARQMASHYGNA